MARMTISVLLRPSISWGECSVGADRKGVTLLIPRELPRDNLYACFAQSKTDAKSKATMYQWSLPEGGARNVSDTGVTACMAGCGRSFGLLGEL
jgi:hypothetical protein